MIKRIPRYEFGINVDLNESTYNSIVKEINTQKNTSCQQVVLYYMLIRM